MANVYGTNGDDNSAIVPGNPSINGTKNGDNLYGWAFGSLAQDDVGNDFLNGFAGIDFLYGGGGNDVLDGGSGDDFMAGGSGDDHYDITETGDIIVEGADQGSSDSATAYGVDYDLAENVYLETLTGDQATDTGFGQILIGNNLDNFIQIHNSRYANTLAGWEGNDHLLGPKAYGGADPDPSVIMTGGDGDDILEPRHGSATLYGQNGNDTMFQATGSTIMEGGLGNDTYHVHHKSFSIIENKSEGRDTVVVTDIGTFTLDLGFENLRAGDNTSVGHFFTGNSAGNRITGSRFSDSIIGLAGGDTLKGGRGADFIAGGRGDDVLYGGKGKDTFDFNSVKDSPGSDFDVIMDWNAGDLIDLTGIDSNATIGGNQAFAIDTGGPHEAGELKLREVPGGTIAEANVDSDAEIEFAVLIANTFGMSAVDFNL